MTQKGKSPDLIRSPDQQGEQRRTKFLTQFSLIAAILLFISAIGDALLYLDIRVWQLAADMTLSTIPSIVAMLAVWQLARRQKTKAAAYILLIDGLVFFPASLFFLQGREFATVSAGFLGIFTAVIILWPKRWLIWAAASGAYMAYTFALMQLNLTEHYDIVQNTSSVDIGVLSSGLFVVLILWLAARAFYGGNIRVRLLMAFMTLASLPLILMVIYLSLVWSQDLQDRIIAQLESVATLKETEIETWLNNLHGDLNISLTGLNAIKYVNTVIQNSPDTAAYQEAYGKLGGRFQQNIDQLARLEEIFLLDSQGKVILSTNPAQEGKIYAQQDFFQQSLAGQNFVQPPHYSPSLGKTSLIVSQPVRNKNGQVIAVLAGRASLEYLNEIMQERSGLGDTGETYLVGSNHALLTDSRFPEYRAGQTYVHTEGVNAAIDSEQTGSGAYDDYRGEAVVGVYHWIPELEIGLLSELDLAEARATTNKTLMVTGIVVFLLISVAVGFALWVTRSIVNPLDSLAQTAVEIADGNLNLNAAVEREDEVGAVAEAFNRMTARLRDLIDSLEQRVADRTQRLELVAALGSRLSEILDFDQLLTEMVNQVKGRFNYYHAHVYIIGEQRKTLLMAAGAGEVGAQMKAQGHSIPLNAPQSLVARAARFNQIVSVDNVRDDPNWLPNPLLPDTWSEMAVPISVEGQVVGVLDIQEDKIAGFDEGDFSLSRLLANQVAIAIRNARLFEQVETALTETRATQDRYLIQSWQQVKTTSLRGQYLYHASDAPPVDNNRLQARQRLAIEQGQPVVADLEDGNQGKKSLILPLKLRDIPIGSLQVCLPDDGSASIAESLSVLQILAEQLADTAETLRLFDETRERASQERTLSEITERMQAATDIESLVKVTAEALGTWFGVDYAAVELGIEKENTP